MIDHWPPEYALSPDAEAFVQDLLATCRKHGMVISHEDTGGAFLVERLNADDVKWFGTPMLGASLRKPGT